MDTLLNITPPPILCKAKTYNPASRETKRVSVDYDCGTHVVSTRLPGLRKADLPRRHHFRVEADRFQRDRTVSEVADRVSQLDRFDDVEGLLNRWVGRFARKNFPLLIKEMTKRGSLKHCVRVFEWMKNQRNYCAYNMIIRLYARHNQTDQARGLFFEMQKWRCKPDAETYNALNNTHGRAGQWHWAMNTLEEML